ncbi:MAG: acylphosphatase [Nanoarchaeota archaeon]|nr:acylphosphatase [Nanoarchaeota archaeon]
MKRAHLIVSGRVQGVWFRDTTNKVASKLGLKGFVRNLPDGNVEVIAEGNEEKIKKLVKFCHDGPEHADVNNVDISYEDSKDEFTTFSIRF